MKELQHDHDVADIEKFCVRIFEGMMHCLLKAMGTRLEGNVHRTNLVGLLSSLVSASRALGSDFILSGLVHDAAHLLNIFGCTEGNASVKELGRR